MQVAGKAVAIRDSEVDKREEYVRQKTQGTPCNDQHIIALLGASRCSLFCSGDSRSFKLVKSRSLYPKGMPTVKVYTSSRNAGALLVTTSKTSLTNVI
jgi:hypothetical protein